MPAPSPPQDGRYTVQAGGNATLVFSVLGYTQQRIEVAGRTSIDVSLAPSALTLDELVAVGYTTQSQRTISGAVTTMPAVDLQQRTVSRLEEAMKGRAPGVTITTTGEPGQAAQIAIRGTAFMGSNSPLYVVDGMYLRQNPNLNPNDIESIQVLKDASAASQYGSQAASGVVIISTKKGRAGQNNRLNLRMSYGAQKMTRELPVVNAFDHARLKKLAIDQANAQLPNSAPPPAQGVLDVLSGANTIDTDWMAEISQPGHIQDHSLAISGGTTSGDAHYFISGGYTDQQGTILDTDFTRYSFRANSELRRGRLTIGENISLSRSDREVMDLNGGRPPHVEAARMVPAIPVRIAPDDNSELYGLNSEGGWGVSTLYFPSNPANPVALLLTRDDEIRTNQAIGTLFGVVEIIPDLDYRLNFGFDYTDLNNTIFQSRDRIARGAGQRFATLEVGRGLTNSLLLENLITLNRIIGPHNINAVVGATAQRNSLENLNASIRNFPDETRRVLSAGLDQIQHSGTKTETRQNSFLGRLSYVLADRYLTELSFRRDGSSRFGPDNRWGNFYAGSLGWVMSEEAFFQNLPLLDFAEYVKVRASYGTLGNQEFDAYEWQANLDQQNLSYIFGQSPVVTPGAFPLSLGNPGIRWQENTMQNYGVDLGLFDNTVSITAEYYISKSDGLLVRAPLPPSIGSEQAPFVNGGSVQNTGVELSIEHAYLRRDFSLTTAMNLTTIRNKVLSLGNDSQPLMTGFAGSPVLLSRTAVGFPMAHFWVYQMDGIFQTQEEVTAHKVQPTARPGDARYVDTNGDGVLNDDDRINGGDSWPSAEGGFFMNGVFRGIDFNVGFRGSYGAKIFNRARWSAEKGDTNDSYTQRAAQEYWTPENRSNTAPRLLFGPLAASNVRPNSTRWIEDGSYLKLQNIQLGYTLPEGLASSLGVPTETARIYLNLQDLHTWTKYRGLDPDFVGNGSATNFTLTRGVDEGRIYPTPRTISVGIDLGL